MRRGLQSALFVCVLLGLAPDAALAAPEDFPKPAAIEPRVAFWKRIYTEVGTGGGLLHDPDDLSLVYEVVAFPNGRWDVAGERHMKARRAHVSRVLQALARGKRSGLSAEEQRILALFPPSVSSRTLRAKANAVRFQLGQSDKFRAGLGRQGRWDAFIRATFSERGLPTEIGALPHVESSFNPDARSSVGASGIWQFMPSTGRLYMRVDSAVDERNDPYLATVAAARLLKANYEEIGAWPLAITAYNHGLGGMRRAVRQLGTRDIGVILEKYKSRSFGFASKNFYASFLAALEIDREPERYFGPIARDPGEDPERVILDHYYRPATLAAAFGVPVDALRQVNPAVSSSVWEGKRLLPQGYELRVPRDPLRAAPKVVLASVAGSERLTSQVPEYHGTHRVRPGETLSSIARRYGVSTRALQRENGLRSANRIHAGQRLKIPGRAGSAPAPVREQPASAAVAASAVPEPAPVAGVYRVRRGDTLASIARRFGVSPTDLAAVNRLRDPNQIHPGQVIELPGGSLSAKPGDRSHAGVYSVRRGDNLDEIAARFGVSVDALIALNGIQNKNRIVAGQTLYVPGPPEPAPAPAAPESPANARAAEPALAPSAAMASASPAAAPSPSASPSAVEPASAPTTYTVRRGDTLEKIAAQTGVSESDLIARNAIRNKHRITAGQTLELREVPAPEPPPREPAPSAQPAAEISPPSEPTPAPAPAAAPAPAPAAAQGSAP
jgi:membrane-bound lytic murein transglycosylase D